MVSSPSPSHADGAALPGRGSALRNATGTRFTRVLGIATLIGIGWLFLFGLFLSPDDIVQRKGVRIMYIHVPSAWLAYLAFIVTGVASAAYLWKRTRSLVWDRVAAASAEVGLVFMAITLITGSLWGRLSWGSYWVWDARLTTTAFLFATYVGYLAVRGLGGSHQQRARRSAFVAVFAAFEIPLVHFSVERWNGLHQQESVAKGKLEDLMLFSLFSGIISFTLLYTWLLIHRQRVLAMQDALEDRGLDLALAERQSEAVG